MNHVLAVGLALLSSLSGLAQNADASLRTQLEGFHPKWFTAFRRADVATMNQMETDNIVLAMTDGSVIKDFSLRKNGDLKMDLAGTSRSGETGIFVLSSGQWKISSAQWTEFTSKK